MKKTEKEKKKLKKISIRGIEIGTLTFKTDQPTDRLDFLLGPLALIFSSLLLENPTSGGNQAGVQPIKTRGSDYYLVLSLKICYFKS